MGTWLFPRKESREEMMEISSEQKSNPYIERISLDETRCKS